MARRSAAASAWHWWLTSASLAPRRALGQLQSARLPPGASGLFGDAALAWSACSRPRLLFYSAVAAAASLLADARLAAHRHWPTSWSHYDAGALRVRPEPSWREKSLARRRSPCSPTRAPGCAPAWSSRSASAVARASMGQNAALQDRRLSKQGVAAMAARRTPLFKGVDRRKSWRGDTLLTATTAPESGAPREHTPGPLVDGLTTWATVTLNRPERLNAITAPR